MAPQGDTTLSLHRAEHPSPESSGSIHFEVDDVNSAVDELKRSGLCFACDQPYLWREAILLDPGGTGYSSTTLARTGSILPGAGTRRRHAGLTFQSSRRVLRYPIFVSWLGGRLLS